MTLQKNWTMPPRNPDAEAHLIQKLKVGPLLARTLIARGFSDPEKAAAFLQEQAAPFYDPFLLKDMDIAVRRIKAAIAKKVAQKYNLGFMELQEKFDKLCESAPASYWLADGVHPTVYGHSFMKDEWLKKFWEMI